MSVGYAKILLSNNERQQMTKVEHSLKFVTEFDETHPTAQRFLELDEASQIAMLEVMLKELIAPALKQTIDELNAGNSYATLKVVA
jgi:thiamine pyrophosphate-dependent acetolactate synthase large subunit-like protein